MPLAGLVFNRVHRSALTALSADESEAAAAALDAAGDQPVTADALRIHGGLLRQTEREVRVAATFTDAFPAVPVIEVTAQPADVHDVDGLRTIGTALTATTSPVAIS
jgi:hypothetical protein